MDIYEKNGLMRPVNSDGSVAHKVTKVKAFARPLSESILLDPKGVNGTGTSSKALNQHLINGVEEFNGSPMDTISVFDNGVETEIHEDGAISCAMTTIYPVNYTEQPFSSENFLKNTSNGLVNGTLSIPITPEEGSFRYSGDVGFNFDVEQDIDLASAYVTGDNIEVDSYMDNNGNRIPSIRLKDTTNRDSARNFVETVFTVPHGNRYGEANVDCLYMNDVRLSTAFTTFLDARNYYDEIIIPHTVNSGTSEFKTGRNDGIRTLKEGEYFFTCKYPFKILPLMDVDISSNTTGMNYANIYGTVRFKISVKGRLSLNGEGDIARSSNAYRDNMVDNFLRSNQSLTNPSDNRSFPHRSIDIELYVLNRSGNSGWTWTRVATNHDKSPYAKEVLLDANALKNPIVLDMAVPMFFSKSYRSAFFSGSPTNPQFDAVEIKVGDGEDIWADSVDDIGSFKLQSEKSYRFLFDYSANITEIAYSKKYHTSVADELGDYSRMTKMNLSDAVESDYLYNTLATGWMASSSQMFNRKCGFNVNYTTTGSTTTFSWDMTSDDALGDPYSTATYDTTGHFGNKLYLFESEYGTMDGSYHIPYMYTNGGYQISCRPQTNGAFNEIAILELHHKQKVKDVTSALATLKSSLVGIVSSMSKLTPKFRENDILPTIVTHEDYDFLSYRTSRQSIPTVTDGILVNTNELFGNNMIATNDFHDSRWASSGTSIRWVSDMSHGNVWQINPTASGVTITYGVGTHRNILSNWDIHFIANGASLSYASVTFIADDGTESVPTEIKKIRNVTGEASWYIWEATVSNRSCTRVRFEFKGNGSAVQISEIEARRKGTVSHLYGLGDCLKTSSTISTLTLEPHEMLLLRNRVDNWMTPLLVRTRVESTSGGFFPMTGTSRQGLLTDGCRVKRIDNGTNETWSLLKPWLAHITYSDKDGGSLMGYAVSSQSRTGVTLRDSEYFTRPSFRHTIGTSNLVVGFGVMFHNANYEWAPVDTNFKVHIPSGNDDPIPTVSLTEETFGGMSNMMNFSKVNNGLPSPVAITNVQLVEETEEGDRVLYEFEYLPIIYDERDQHMSFNYVVVLDKGADE